MCIRIVVTLSLLIFFLSQQKSVGSENYYAFNPNILEEVANATIFVIEKTSEDEIYIATSNGIFHFDYFTLSRVDIELETENLFFDNQYFTFFEGPKGYIYLLTGSSGTYLKTPQSPDFQRINEPVKVSSSNPVLGFFVDDNLPLVASLTESSFWVFDRERGNFQYYKFDSSENQHRPQGIAMKGNSVQVFYSGGLVKNYDIEFDGIRYSGSMKCDSDIPQFFKSIRLSDQNLLISASTGGVYSVVSKDSKCSVENRFSSLNTLIGKSYVPEVVFLKKTNELLLASRNGVFLHNLRSKKTVSFDKSIGQIRSDFITAVEPITDRLFWAGSFLGVVELRKQNIEVVTRVIDESSPEILGFTESNSDKLFLTTPNRIYSFQLEAVPFQFEVVYVARKDEYLSSLAWLSGKLVAGFASGDIALLEPRSSSKEPWSIACRIKNESTTQSPVVSLEEISDFKGEEFVLAAWLDGTIRKIHGCRATPYLSSSDSAKVTEGLMTLGPSKALRGTLAFSFSGPRFFTNDEHPTLVNPFLKAEQELKLSKSWLSVDVDESVVLASVQGELFKLDMSSDSSDIYQENIKELPGAAGLKNIQSMEVDLMDRVWVASNSGVWLAGADDLSLQYRLDPDLPISFDHAVSLSSNSGALLFGGTGGFLVIRNPADFPNLRTGGLAISSMALDGVLRDRQSLVAANTILEISNSFTVTMGQKYPRHHDSTSVEHKLVGYDEDWVSSGSRGIATYRGLPPGDYTFRARGTNATGDISANEIELEIHVTTPFWRTYWAYLLYALFAGYLLHLSKRLNDQRVLRSERLLFAEQQEAAFARLEDDYQEQHEASQRLLMREQDGLQENLAAIQLVLDAERNCPIGPPQDSIAPKLTEVFSELQQEITFTAWSKQISCRQLADVVARLTLGDRRGDVDIVVANHADDTAISSRVAFYLCIPLVEVLCVMNRTLDTSQIPLAVVSTRIEKTDDSSLNDEAPRSGMVVVLDSDFSWISDDEELEDLLFRTAYTLESVGGSMERKASPSNQIQVLIGLQ